MKLFLQKNAKFLNAGVSAPRLPKQRISGYTPASSKHVDLFRTVKDLRDLRPSTLNLLVQSSDLKLVYN